MGQLASLVGAEPYEVEKCRYMENVCYLAPGATSLSKCSTDTVPPVAVGAVRVVCISDTHNEHSGLHLPPGDLLIHAGDCLTESGLRHVVREKGGCIKKVKPQGEFLFRIFAEWLGSQRYAYKVLIAGNHDLVLQGLGKARVQEILDESSAFGKAVYLEHEEAEVGGVRVFGSPFGHWGSHNDAFAAGRSLEYSAMTPGTHIMVTHSPAILPGEGGQGKSKDPVVSSLHRTGALLHVSGHCHWAHGLYLARGERDIPCVVASVCDSKWLGGLGGWIPGNSKGKERPLASAEGVRGDPVDRIRGGYNLVQPSIVCDLLLPGGRPAELREDPQAALAALGPPRTIAARAQPAALAAELSEDVEERSEKPALLFFGSPNDPDFVEKALPMCQEHFQVEFVETTAEGLEAVGRHDFRACVAKLGTEGNLSYPILEALRQKQGRGPFIAVHSLTAANSYAMQEKLITDLDVDHFAKPGEEAELLRALRDAVALQDFQAKPSLLFFGPSNDVDFIQHFLPRCREHFAVDHVCTTAQGVQAVADRNYGGCVAKLGTEGNLCYPILEALQKKSGQAFMAVHSATAAKKQGTQQQLREKYGVTCFSKPGDEDSLLAALISSVK